MTTRTALPLIAGTFGLLLLTGCGSISVEFGEESIDGSGDVITETIDVDAFTAIDIQDAFDVEIEVGEDRSVVLEGDDNLLEKADVSVDGSELIVRLEGASLGSGTLRATITVPSLDSLDVSGASEVSVQGLSESAMAVDLSGASSVTLAGEVTELEIDLSGASDVQSDLLEVSTVVVDLSGASSLFLETVDTLEGDLSGASSLSIPASTDATIDSSGASDVERR